MTEGIIDHHHDAEATDLFGFWLYLMTDCVLFGSLFAVFLVLHQPGAFGPALKPLIDLNYVLIETTLLLVSNLAYGLAMMANYHKLKWACILALAVTFLFGVGFVAMELYEFIHLIHEGYIWSASAAASAFFTLVATHGLHVTFGLVWIVVMLVQVFYFGLNSAINRRLTYLGLFWNFLDIVWIFVFTIVYLMGAI